jgi:ribulose-5-phosphate 4-epimerase/fuculose-1-phosphate aldolase
MENPSISTTAAPSTRVEARRGVLETARHLAETGFLVGTGGNISIRVPGEEALAITPSGRAYETMTPDDICVVGWDGTLLEGELAPSVETGMHTAVYRHREDAGSVIHTHQPFVSVLAILGEGIPALFDEQVMNLGIAVDVVPYAVSGSQDLLANVAGSVDNGCNAFILANHGALVIGTTVEDAVRNIALLEKAARVYVTALTTNRPINPLPAEMAEAIFELHKSEQRKAIRRLRRAARQE